MVSLFLYFFISVQEVLVDKVLITVGDRPVTLSEVREVASLYHLSITQAVEKVIEGEIIEIKAKEMGIEVNEKEIEEEVNHQMLINGVSPEGFVELVKKEGFRNLEHYKSEIRKNILRHKVALYLFQKGGGAGEEELRRYYLANPDVCLEERKVELYHIFLKGKEACERADYIYREIKLKKKEARLQSVEELAEKYSEAPSRSEKGRIGWIRRGELVKELEEIAFSLPPGEVAPPVAVKNGFHIIFVNNIKEKERLPFEMCEEEVIKKYINEKREEILEQWIRKQKRKLGVEVKEPEILKN